MQGLLTVRGSLGNGGMSFRAREPLAQGNLGWGAGVCLLVACEPHVRSARAAGDRGRTALGVRLAILLTRTGGQQAWPSLGGNEPTPCPPFFCSNMEAE